VVSPHGWWGRTVFHEGLAIAASRPDFMEALYEGTPPAQLQAKQLLEDFADSGLEKLREWALELLRGLFGPDWTARVLAAADPKLRGA
jgi:hypothetical protein